MKDRSPNRPTHSQIILSLFPGVDIFGRGFEDTGYCVLRGPDPLWGGDIRHFHIPSGRIDGIIGGPPCQDFSDARRDPATGYGIQMLHEFARVVKESDCIWWLMENVRNVPNLFITGYSHQRLDIRASEFGLKQRRLRHFQYGHKRGLILTLPREDNPNLATEPAVLASAHSRPWAKFLALQGLPPDFDIPGFTVTAKKRAVGNGVPYPVARALAHACLNPVDPTAVNLCACGCGRPITPNRKTANDACRKRYSLQNKGVIRPAVYC